MSAALLSEEAANQIVGGIVLLKGCQRHTPPADLFSHEWNFFSAWGMSVFGHYKKATYIEMGRERPASWDSPATKRPHPPNLQRSPLAARLRHEKTVHGQLYPRTGNKRPAALFAASTPLRDYLAMSFIFVEIKPFPHLKVVALTPACESILPKIVLMLGVLDDEFVAAIITFQRVVDSVCVQQVENIRKVASFFAIIIHSD